METTITIEIYTYFSALPLNPAVRTLSDILLWPIDSLVVRHLLSPSKGPPHQKRPSNTGRYDLHTQSGDQSSSFSSSSSTFTAGTPSPLKIIFAANIIN